MHIQQFTLTKGPSVNIKKTAAKLKKERKKKKRKKKEKKKIHYTKMYTSIFQNQECEKDSEKINGCKGLNQVPPEPSELSSFMRFGCNEQEQKLAAA